MSKKLFWIYLFIICCLSVGCSRTETDEASIEAARELYEQSIATNENYKRIALRKKIIKLAPDSAYGYFSEAWFL